MISLILLLFSLLVRLKLLLSQLSGTVFHLLWGFSLLYDIVEISLLGVTFGSALYVIFLNSYFQTTFNNFTFLP